MDRGEALVGLTDTDDVWAAQARGSGVQLIYPRHDLPGERGGGTLVVPNAAGLVAGGANPDGGRALLQYLVSTDVEQALHASNSHNIPLVSDFEIDPRYRVDDPMRLSIPLAAKVMDPAVKEAMERLDPDRIERLRAPGPGRSVPNETGDS